MTNAKTIYNQLTVQLQNPLKIIKRGIGAKPAGQDKLWTII